MGKLGVELSPISDDLMALRYDDLDLRWKRASMALAGVTLAEALFVLETLAADRGMRVVYRGEHLPAERGVIRHRLAGPKALVARLAALAPAAPWEAELAHALAACPLGQPEPAEPELVTRVSGLSLRRDDVLVDHRAAVRGLVDAADNVWVDTPDPGWGSLVGNAMDHGIGYTMGFYRDHFGAHCGMEVVLPNGEVMRTGMRAMPASSSWQEYRHGYGPDPSGLFGPGISAS